MGREIRKVPPNWKHPKMINPESHQTDWDQPMFDQTFESKKREWIDGLLAWEKKEDPCYDDEYEYWEYYGGPPDKHYYRPWEDSEATWFQVWQTVSEGSPVTPPFATPEELIAYLAENGDFLDQGRGNGAWGIESATAFVKSGWSCSMAIVDGILLESKDIPLYLDKNKESS